MQDCSERERERERERDRQRERESYFSQVNVYNALFFPIFFTKGHNSGDILFAFLYRHSYLSKRIFS